MSNLSGLLILLGLVVAFIDAWPWSILIVIAYKCCATSQQQQ